MSKIQQQSKKIIVSLLAILAISCLAFPVFYGSDIAEKGKEIYTVPVINGADVTADHPLSVIIPDTVDKVSVLDIPISADKIDIFKDPKISVEVANLTEGNKTLRVVDEAGNTILSHEVDMHNECRGGSCSPVAGVGVDSCNLDADCVKQIEVSSSPDGLADSPSSVPSPIKAGGYSVSVVESEKVLPLGKSSNTMDAAEVATREIKRELLIAVASPEVVSSGVAKQGGSLDKSKGSVSLVLDSETKNPLALAVVAPSYVASTTATNATTVAPTLKPEFGCNNGQCVRGGAYGKCSSPADSFKCKKSGKRCDLNGLKKCDNYFLPIEEVDAAGGWTKCENDSDCAPSTSPSTSPSVVPSASTAFCKDYQCTPNGVFGFPCDPKNNYSGTYNYGCFANRSYSVCRTGMCDGPRNIPIELEQLAIENECDPTIPNQCSPMCDANGQCVLGKEAGSFSGQKSCSAVGVKGECPKINHYVCGGSRRSKCIIKPGPGDDECDPKDKWHCMHWSCDTHSETSYACNLIGGEGEDECTRDFNDDGRDPHHECRHRICDRKYSADDEMRCIWGAGKGEDQCKDDEDQSCSTYRDCSLLGYCQKYKGEGKDKCSTDAECSWFSWSETKTCFCNPGDSVKTDPDGKLACQTVSGRTYQCPEVDDSQQSSSLISPEEGFISLSKTARAKLSSEVKSTNISKKIEIAPEKIDNLFGKPSYASDKSKVKIEIFQDLNCGMCKYAYKNMYAGLISEYVSKGLVSLDIKEFPLIQREKDLTEARAVICAGEQNKYGAYLDKIYKWDTKKEPHRDLTKIAKESSLDLNAFNACLNAESTIAKLNSNIEEGKNRGINGTPTVILNGTQIGGAMDFEKLQGFIEKVLIE